MMIQTCPPVEQLQKYLLGVTAAAEQQVVLAHIEDCTVCQHQLTQLEAADDDFTSQVRKSGDETNFVAHTDTEFDLLRPKLEAIPPRHSRHAEKIGNRDDEHGTGNAETITLPPGQLLPNIRDYEILNPLGAGGMGTVYRARHSRLGKIVALKLLSEEFAADPELQDRFAREMAAIGQLAHPHIVPAFDAGVFEERHFLVMEYVEGRDLAEVVRCDGPLSVSAAVDCVLQAARGLAYVHERGLIHRDIKPGNLLQDNSGVVKVLDLGLARWSGTHDRDNPHASPALTTAGSVMGTVDYMAPEQGVNPSAADVRSDIYGLGCTLFFLLTGKCMYPGGTIIERIFAHRDLPIPQLTQMRAEASTGLQTVFATMVAKEPETRFQSMEDVIEALEELKRSVRGAAKVDVPSVTPERQEFAASQTSSPQTSASNSIAGFVSSHKQALGLGLTGLIAAVWLAFSVIFVQTEHGTLRVEFDAADVEVRVQGTKVTITGADPQPVELTTGKHTLVVQHGELQLTTTDFTIKNKGITVVKVELLEGELRVVDDNEKIIGRRDMPKVEPNLRPNSTPTQAVVAWASPLQGDNAIVCFTGVDIKSGMYLSVDLRFPQGKNLEEFRSPTYQLDSLIIKSPAKPTVEFARALRAIPSMKSVELEMEFTDEFATALIGDGSPLPWKKLVLRFTSNKNQIDSEILAKLLNCLPNMQSLQLLGTTANNTCLASIGRMKDLEGLSLHFFSQLAPEWIGFTPEGLKPLHNLPRLRYISIAGIPKLSMELTAGLAELKLHTVALAPNPHREGPVPANLLKPFAKPGTVHLLSLQGFPFLTAADLEPLRSTQHILALDCVGCGKLGDDAVETIGSMKSLTKLLLRGTAITPVGRMKLQQLLPQCTILPMEN